MTQTALTRHAPPQPVPGDARVLATRPLRASARLEDTAVFADDIWSLAPAVPRADRRSAVLDFATLPVPFRDVAKQLCFAMLTGDAPAGEPVLAIGSIRRLFTPVRRFLRWAEERVDRLADLTADQLVDYHAAVVDLPLATGSKAFERRACRLFWIYRAELASDGLQLDPRHLPQWQAWERAHSGRRSSENTTPRIPEPVIGPLLTWALRWIGDFADDVLAARDEYLNVRFRRWRSDTA